MEDSRLNLNIAPQEPELWPITKVLTDSDTSTKHARISFAKKPFREHIVEHMSIETKSRFDGVQDFESPIRVVDDDMNKEYEMKLKSRGGSYNLSNLWNNVIRDRGLKTRDIIKFRWADGCLHFTVPPPSHC